MALRALTSAVTGMNVQQSAIEIISNNLANISTTAYKRQNGAFEDLMYQEESRAGVNPTGNIIIPTSIQVGLGAKLSAIYRNNNQGEFQQTNNQFDVAIKGEGYFNITLPDGTTAYTRAGNFTLDNNGNITTLSGYPLYPNIQIPQGATSVTISDTGVVTVIQNGQVNSPSQIGTIQLSTFVNENGLDALGGNLYVETPASGSPSTGNPHTNDLGGLLQGWLEISNVNAVKELTDLIQAQRSYELCSKVIKTCDDILQVINNTKS